MEPFSFSFCVFLFKLQFTSCLIDLHQILSPSCVWDFSLSSVSLTFLIFGLVFQTLQLPRHDWGKNLLLTDVVFCTTDARFVYPIIDRFSLQLISPVSWEIIPSTRLVLGRYHINRGRVFSIQGEDHLLWFIISPTEIHLCN